MKKPEMHILRSLCAIMANANLFTEDLGFKDKVVVTTWLYGGLRI